MKKWIAIVVLGLIPIVFAPVVQDFYDTNKLALLAATAAVLFISSGITFVSQKKPISVSISRGVIALGPLLVASLISLVLASTNKVDALMAPLGLVAVLALTGILSTLSKPSEEMKTLLAWAIIGSSIVLGLITLYQFLGMGRIMFPAIPYLQNPLWTPAGTTTTTIAIFAVTLALIIPRIRSTYGKPHLQNAFIFYMVSLFIIAGGLVLSLIQFVPKISGSVLPLSDAWMVTLETLKNAKAAAFGVGAENFVSAYSMGKPLSMMATNLWNVRFGASADFFLHMTTIYGLIGLAGALAFTWQFIKEFKSPLTLAHIVYLLCLIIVPPTITILSLGAVLLVLSDAGHNTFHAPLAHWTRYVFGTILVVFGAGGLYLIGRAYSGELTYFSALQAAQNNQGSKTYTQHNEAIKTNPYTVRYHITFSQVNMALANSIASQASQSAQTRQTISQLAGQSISEAKTAVTLNTQNITAWENLAAEYQTLMPVAQGADSWAAASYQKALSIDPTNPLLWVNFGGVLVHEKKYDDAIVAFQRAIIIKPDLANAYYNMANAYKLKGDVTNATSALTKTMSLVQPGSSDYVKVKNELDGIPSATVSAKSQLTLPP